MHKQQRENSIGYKYTEKKLSNVLCDFMNDNINIKYNSFTYRFNGEMVLFFLFFLSTLSAQHTIYLILLLFFFFFLISLIRKKILSFSLKGKLLEILLTKS